MRISKRGIRTEDAHKSTACAVLALLLLGLASSAGASLNESVLYAFQGGGDGAAPLGLAAGPNGVLYGVTDQGGDPQYCQPTGCGMVFQLSPPIIPGHEWTKTVLLQFTGPNGAEPLGGLLLDSGGNLYGTTAYGGANGAGVVFELSPPLTPAGVWTETVVHDFGASLLDGAGPFGSLLMDSDGNLFGATQGGGSSCGVPCGTVFELTPPAKSGGAWTESILFDFGSAGGFDGAWPNGSLIQTASGVNNPAEPPGALYGTTYLGGSRDNGGVVFQLLPPLSGAGPWTINVLHIFRAFSSHAGDGFTPSAGLYMDSNGNLFGTTDQGGIIDNDVSWGTVFEVSPPSQPGGRWSEKVVYDFTNQNGDGYYPEATIVADSNGSLYSTASFGGRNELCLGGCGMAFRLDNIGGSWVETILYDFLGANGAYPGNLLLGPNDTIFGGTGGGGGHGAGVVFELK